MKKTVKMPSLPPAHAWLDRLAVLAAGRAKDGFIAHVWSSPSVPVDDHALELPGPEREREAQAEAAKRAWEKVLIGALVQAEAGHRGDAKSMCATMFCPHEVSRLAREWVASVLVAPGKHSGIEIAAVRATIKDLVLHGDPTYLPWSDDVLAGHLKDQRKPARNSAR